MISNRRDIKNGFRTGKASTVACLLVLVLLCAGMLTGCHGSRGMDPFVIPEEFDTSKEYEITFWAKNDTNKTQTAIYEQAIEDFEEFIPISM